MTSDEMHTLDVTIILNRLQEIAQAVMHAAEAETLEVVLERIAALSRQLIPCRYAALGIPDGRGSLKYFKTSGMSPEELAMMERLPQGHGLLGAIMMERRTIRLDSIQRDLRSSGFPKHHPYMESFLGTPVQVGDQLFGMLYLCDRAEGPFTISDEWMLETIAGYAALAIAGSNLRDKQRRLTLLEERQRISMELHDGVIQSLYAVGMYLDLLRTAGPTLESGKLKPAIDDLNATIDDVRSYIMNLKHMDMHQKVTIRGCLQDLVKRLRIPNVMHVEIDAPNSVPLFTPEVFESVCQIVNEGLSNALRHSGAQHLKITALQTQSALIITIKDDGEGFEMEEISARDGLGLRNMRHRAAQHNGQLLLESSRGNGTRLTITVPIQERR